MDQKVIVGVIAHVGKQGAAECVVECCKALRAGGVEVLLEQATARLIGENSDLDVPELNRRVTALVVMGGDGTILNVLRDLNGSGEPKPIVGVNLGRLGFLTAVSRQDAERAVDLIVENEQGCYTNRLMLDVQIECADGSSTNYTALNEVTFTRGAVPRLIELETHVDGSLLTVYNADGLIVATPTGSTAYSLAAGGPVLAPNLDAIILTPICPHVITNRALVISADSHVTVTPRPGYSEIYATVDGQTQRQICPGDKVRICRSPWHIRLAILPEDTFFKILREKLKWSGTSLPVL